MEVAHKLQFSQFGQPASTIRNNVENHCLAGARRNGKIFCPGGEGMHGLLDISLQTTAKCFCQSWVPCVAAAAVFARASGGGRP